MSLRQIGRYSGISSLPRKFTANKDYSLHGKRFDLTPGSGTPVEIKTVAVQFGFHPSLSECKLRQLRSVKLSGVRNNIVGPVEYYFEVPAETSALAGLTSEKYLQILEIEHEQDEVSLLTELGPTYGYVLAAFPDKGEEENFYPEEAILLWVETPIGKGQYATFFPEPKDSVWRLFPRSE